MEIIKNEDGTITCRWKDWSNGKDNTGWDGQETGGPDREATFAPEELDFIDIDTNHAWYGLFKAIHRISPSEMVFFAHKMKELLPNFVKIEQGWFDDRFIRTYWINLDRVEVYCVGELHDTLLPPMRKRGCMVNFKHSLNRLRLIGDGEVNQFVEFVKAYTEKNEVRDTKSKQ